MPPPPPPPSPQPSPPAATPTATGVPVRFDDAVAAALAVALDRLAEELAGAGRRVRAHADGARVDWAGHTRRWFDDRIEVLEGDVRAAARLAAAEADAVRRARLWAVAETERRAEEARRAAAAELVRLTELAARPAA